MFWIILLIVVVLIAVAIIENFGIWVFLGVMAVIIVIVVILVKKHLRKKAEEEIRKAEQEAKEKAEEELRAKERQERRAKYKADVLSGAISYDKEVQEIIDAYSKSRSEYLTNLAKVTSIVNEYNSMCSTGNWDSGWTADQVKKAKLLPPNIDFAKLNDLLEIKGDDRLSKIQSDYSLLIKDFNNLDWKLHNLQKSFIL